MQHLALLTEAESRSISPENFSGEPGKGGMATSGTGAGCAKELGQGWKISPSICGTGTEDYFCGSYNFENQETHRYQEYSTPYAGLPQVIRPDGLYQSQTRFGMYRWHITDPIRFKKNTRVTIQALGWRNNRQYLPLQDDMASVAYWYQSLPTAPFPALLSKNALEII